MGIKTRKKDGICKVMIDESMTIYEVVDQKTKLINALKKIKKDEQLEIDLSNVNEMDTAGLQILLSLKKTAEKSEKMMLLTEHSPASLDVIDKYNLAAHFGDPVMISSADR